MQWYRLPSLGIALAILGTALLLAAHSASACSVGPSAVSAPELPAADLARMALRNNDFIAEVTVMSRVAPSERGKQCRLLMTFDCTGENADPRCEGAADRFFEYCTFDAAIRVQVGRTWKNTMRNTSDIIYVEKGGYPHQALDPDGSCDSNPVIKTGDSFVFCGSFDKNGALAGSACDHDALFDQVKTRREALVAAVMASPKNPVALGELARFLEDWGEVDAALAAYAKLRSLSPDGPAGYAGTGRILYAKQEYAKAVPYLELAGDHAPADAEIAALLAAAQREIRYCAAMQRNPLLACRKPL